MLPQIIAGLGSFALAKMSGASTRNALISGLFGGATSFGIGQLTKAAGTGVTSSGIPFDIATGIVKGDGEKLTGISKFLSEQFMKNPKLAESVIEYGSGLSGQVLTPAFVGTAVGMSQEKPYLYNLFDTYHDKENKHFLGEDFAFCRLWRNLGGQCHCYIMDYITHVGEFQYTGRLWDEMRPSSIEEPNKSR